MHAGDGAGGEMVGAEAQFLLWVALQNAAPVRQRHADFPRLGGRGGDVRFPEFQFQKRGEVAAHAQHAQHVGAVGRDFNVQDVVGRPERPQRRPGRRFPGADEHDARVLVTDAEFAFAGGHAPALHALHFAHAVG